ncbi:MAG TPA: glycosyltransferase family 4 protein [Allosphingosinicella sp.]|jgi:glycosyltransferase involved in cell wall biosynthesis
MSLNSTGTDPAEPPGSENEAAGGEKRPVVNAVLHLDSAYTVANVRARQHFSFFDARHRGQTFDKIYGVHPLTGLIDGRRPVRLQWVRYSPRQLILDGYVEGEPQPRWKAPFQFLAAQARLFRASLRLARRPEVKLIFAANEFYLGLFGLLLAWLTKKPLVVAAYANQDELYAGAGTLANPRLLPARWLEKLVQRLVLRRAAMIESPTLNMRDYVIRNGARPERVEMLPVVKYLPKVHFKPPAERPSPDGFLRSRGLSISDPVLLTVSRLHLLKHVDDAIHAMAIALRSDPKLVALIAGEGPHRAECEQLIRESGVGDRIYLLGDVDQQVLSRLYPRAVVLSPLTGMALIEAGLGESAIVAYDRDWQAEFLESDVTGYLVPYRAVDAMAERVIELTRDPALRARFGKAVREMALVFADPDRMAAREYAAFAPFLDRS